MGGDVAQVKRDSRIENRTNRNKLQNRREPYWRTLELGRALGYRRGSTGGTWIARLYLAGDKRDLRYKTLGAADDHADPDGVTVLSFAQAQTKAREWFAVAHSFATGEEIRTGPYTVADAVADYLRDGKRRGLKSLDRLESGARLHILPELGTIEVAKLTRIRIERWHEALANSAPKRRVGRVPKIQIEKTGDEKTKAKGEIRSKKVDRSRKASSNRVLTILKSSLNHAKARGKVSASGEAWREARPFRGVDTARVRFLSLEEQFRLANVCPPEFRRLVQGALFSGARYGELVRLRVHDFDPQAGTVFVAESKSGKPRYIYLTEEGQTFFREITASRKGGELVFLRDRVNRRTRRHLADAEGWSPSEQQRPIFEACTLAKIDPPITFHELRHTYASTLVNREVPLAYIAAQLGHADTRMVEKHYGHLAPNVVATTIREKSPILGIHEPKGIEVLKAGTQSS